MKRIAVLAILTLVTMSAGAQAPADTITGNVSFPKTYGAGYSTFAIGASAEFWKQVDERRRIFVGGKFGIDRQDKEYIGAASYTLRGSFHARIGLPFGKSWAVRPFAGGGISLSQQRNPRYTKFAYAPIPQRQPSPETKATKEITMNDIVSPVLPANPLSPAQASRARRMWRQVVPNLHQ